MGMRIQFDADAQDALGKGLTGLVLVCDHCEERIRDGGMGVVVWSRDDLQADGDQTEAFFVHKGDCHDALDERLGGKSARMPWSELNTAVHHLLHNAGIKPEDRLEDLADG